MVLTSTEQVNTMKPGDVVNYRYGGIGSGVNRRRIADVTMGGAPIIEDAVDEPCRNVKVVRWSDLTLA